MGARYGLLAVLGLPLLVTALSTRAQEPVKPSKDVTRAATLAVQIDPATRVDAAQLPNDIGRRALEALGLSSEQLQRGRAVTYSATHLEDDGGELAVYFASVVKHNGRWVFWSADVPRETVRAVSEVQLSFATQRDARYLVDFALDSGPQEFALVSAETRTTQAPLNGHLALVVTASGKEHKIRLLPLGDAQFNARWFTLFNVTVTPIL